MAKLPPLASTVTAIYEGYESRARSAPPRGHLGASEIGRECERAIWYSFRWAKSQTFEGRILRLFDTGKLEEDRIVADLNSVGVEVHAFDMRTGRQFRFDAFGGHFGGSLDGICRGLVEAPVAWHVLEMKTHNDKSFNDLCSKGVRDSKPEHFYQMQAYMGMSHDKPLPDIGKIDRAYYIAVNKNNDQLYAERVRYDDVVYKYICDRANRIIFGSRAPIRISDSPNALVCKWCNFRKTCHGTRGGDIEWEKPSANCRTCLHATPVADGAWRCEKWNRVLTLTEQRAGCEKHLYLPAILPFKQIDATDDSVIYEGAVNYEGGEIV